jgi:hypothetical protein
MNPSPNRSHRIIAAPHRSGLVVSIILLVFTLFFFYASRPIEMSDNSLGYIARLDQSSVFDPPLYPPHLLHMPIILLLHSFLSTISSCNVACAGMLHSVIWAAVTIISIYSIAQVILGTALGAIGTTIMVLVSHGLWVYATQVEVYVPVVGCITAATALLFTNRYAELTMTRVITVAALWALATMYHTANVLLFVPFAAFFYGTQGSTGWRQLATVSALAGSAVLATFVGAHWWAQNERWSVGGLVFWVLEITDRPLTYYGSLSNLGPKGFLRGVLEQIETITVLPDYFTLDQRYPFDQMPLAVIGALILSATLLWNCIQTARRHPFEVARVYFILLFLTNFLFFVWWEPGTHKFYIPSSIPLIMLMALAVRDMSCLVQGKRGRWMLGGTVATVIAAMFVFNLPSILELRRSRGPFYADAAILNRLAPENCRIYSVGAHTAALSVYFDRHDSAFMPGLERDFYGLKVGEVRPEEPRFKDEECALIALGWLAEQRYKRYSGALDPASWPEYVGYVLDARVSPRTDDITYNPFEVVTEGDGPPHLLVDRRRRVRARSLDELAEMINAEVDRALETSEPACRTDEYVWIFLTVPRTNFEIDRDRDLIFGYSWHSGNGDIAMRFCRPAARTDR